MGVSQGVILVSFLPNAWSGTRKPSNSISAKLTLPVSMEPLEQEYLIQERDSQPSTTPTPKVKVLLMFVTSASGTSPMISKSGLEFYEYWMFRNYNIASTFQCQSGPQKYCLLQ